MNILKITIKELELKLLHFDFRNDPSAIDELLAEGFEEVGSTGKVTKRDDVVKWLLTKETEARWKLTEFKVKSLSPDIVLANYHVVQVGHQTGSIRASIWRKSGDHWQMVFHQATKTI